MFDEKPGENPSRGVTSQATDSVKGVGVPPEYATMTTEHRQLDPVEEALLQLDAAEEAGLFRRSRVDTKRLLIRSAASKPGWFGARLAAAAAVVVLAVGAWSWMYHARMAELSQRVGVTDVVAEAPVASPGEFYKCFDGPTGALRASCRDHDYDADGDVDLADFSAYQLAYAGMTR